MAEGEPGGGRRAARKAAFPERLLVEPVHGRLYLGLQGLRGRPLGRLIRRLQAWERLEPAEFHRVHERQLQRVLRYARERVPLYRTQSWQSALSHGSDRIDSWPVLEREVLRAHPEELRTAPLRPWHVLERTSGTTGSRVPIAMTGLDVTWRWAQRYRALLWHGIPIGARTLRVSRVPRPLRDRVLGQWNVPTPFTEAALDEAARFLAEERPCLVFGPPSALFVLARHLHGRGGPERAARFARVGGEQLFPFQRSEIEGWLAERVVDSYGCTEVGPVAGECPVGSLHVLDEQVHLEVLRGDAPADMGDLGDLALTSLRNTLMPLIRCRIGDRGRLSPDPCRCGLPHPVLADLQARSTDVFHAADGSPRHVSDLVGRLGSFFDDPVSAGARHVLFGQVDARSWQVWVEAVPGSERADPDGGPGGIERRLAGLVREVCGAECRVETHFVDAIPRGRGKYRYHCRLEGRGESRFADSDA